MAADTSGSAALGSHPRHPGLEWEPGAPRFDVGGKSWRVPSDPKAPWGWSIPEMLPGGKALAAWAAPCSIPQNLLFPVSLKSIFHCFPRIKQAPTARQDLQGVDDVIIGFFPHKPGSLKYQWSTTHMIQPGWNFFLYFEPPHTWLLPKASSSISTPINPNPPGLELELGSPRSLKQTLGWGQVVGGFSPILSENPYSLANLLPAKTRIFFECQNRMFLTISGHSKSVFLFSF